MAKRQKQKEIIAKLRQVEVTGHDAQWRTRPIDGVTEVVIAAVESKCSDMKLD